VSTGLGVAEALETMTGGDHALAAAAMLYASAYEENPAAVIGMLCVTQGILLQQVSELHEVLMQIKPVLDNPSVLLDSIPPSLRAMLGV
jgi:hypothetical protein